MKNLLFKYSVFKYYLARLIFRAMVFLFALYVYFMRPELIGAFLSGRINADVIGFYAVWAILMTGMLHQFQPYRGDSMGSRKQHSEIYAPPPEGYDREALRAYVKNSNSAARRSLIFWLLLNGAVIGVYLVGLIGDEELILLSMFYYLSDLICVVIWCPFQEFFMKNRCCVNCRIFNWGWFMICTPLVMIRSFMTLSLFFISLVVLLRWEFSFAKYPERFWEGSNLNLRCADCKDKLCRVKKPLRGLGRR